MSKIASMKKLSAIALATALAPVLLSPATSRASAAPLSSCESATTASVAPPANFNPVTASDAELACYGFPRRPTDPRQYAAWQYAMSRARIYVAPHFQALTDAQRKVVSPDAMTQNTNVYWAGYTVRAAAQTKPSVSYTYVTGIWNTPTDTSSTRVLAWVGLGGDQTTSGCQKHTVFTNIAPDLCIEQAGTLSQSGTAQFWWEDYPDNQIQEDTNVPVAQGDSVYVSVQDNGDGFTTTYFWEDATTGRYTSADHTSPDYSLSSADYIVEQNFGGTGYGHFGTVTFSSCSLNYTSPSGSGGGVIGAYNFNQYTMVNSSGATQAYPGFLNSTQDGFSVVSKN